jgi:hypothetical protein
MCTVKVRNAKLRNALKRHFVNIFCGYSIGATRWYLWMIFILKNTFFKWVKLPTFRFACTSACTSSRQYKTLTIKVSIYNSFVLIILLYFQTFRQILSKSSLRLRQHIYNEHYSQLFDCFIIYSFFCLTVFCLLSLYLTFLPPSKNIKQHNWGKIPTTFLIFTVHLFQ